MDGILQYPITASLLLTMAVSLCLSLIPNWSNLAYLPLSVLTTGLFLIYPFVLTILNLVFCLRKSQGELWRRAALRIEAVTMVLGVLFSLLLLTITNIDFQAGWEEVLYNGAIHSPVWPHAWPTVIVCLCVGLAGYGCLRRAPFQKMPPLWIVLSMSAMYLGMAVCALWVAQLFDLESLDLFFCLLPMNWIFLCIRLIREKIQNWKAVEEAEKRRFSNPFLEKLNQKVMDSASWPLWSFLLLWPLAGLCLMVLALFGQRPDNIIRAWAETSQWNLSAQVSPPNIVTDGHYLCTVAATGHRRLVKPERAGIRHGQKVIVNRQLCVANAFEQILEERLPGFHRKVRDFYDACGLPVSRLIRSPYQADLVYLLMKPLEWIFLAVIYLNDPRPEDRIRTQYTDVTVHAMTNHLAD